MAAGWVKLHRALLDKPIWQCSSPEQKAILITMLMLASHEDRQWIWKGKKCKVQPGQFITSLSSLADKSGTTIQNVRTSLKIFSKIYEFSTYESTHQSTLVTIENWGIYQDLDTQPNTQANERLTNDQHTPNTRLTTIKNDKKEKNERRKEDKKYIGSEIDLSFIVQPDLLESFQEFIEHRKQIKKPMTQLAAKKAYQQLQKLSNSIDDQVQIINNSIANGWQGLFPLKDQPLSKPTKSGRWAEFYEPERDGETIFDG